jgi:hypothetical protein
MREAGLDVDPKDIDDGLAADGTILQSPISEVLTAIFTKTNVSTRQEQDGLGGLLADATTALLLS